MPDSKETEIIKKLRTRIDSGDLDDKTTVTFRISGGMPSQRLERELKLSGNGKAKTVIHDKLHSIPRKEASKNLDIAETRDLLDKISLSLDELLPLSEIKFLPDSLVGSITIDVDGKQIELFFHPEEEEALPNEQGVKHLEKKISKLAEAVKLVDAKSRQILSEVK